MMKAWRVHVLLTICSHDLSQAVTFNDELLVTLNFFADDGS